MHSRKSIFKLGKGRYSNITRNDEGQSEDEEPGEPILVKLSSCVKTCCSQQAVAITARLLTTGAFNAVLVFDSRPSDQKKRRDCGETMAYRDEKSFLHVAMAAKFLDLNKHCSGKYGRKD